MKRAFLSEWVGEIHHRSCQECLDGVVPAFLALDLWIVSATLSASRKALMRVTGILLQSLHLQEYVNVVLPAVVI